MGMLARHRVAPNMLMILMLIVGAWAISQMNIRFFPKFAVQTVMVKSVWEGAAAEDVEKSLITPLENELRNVDGLEKMTAVANDGAGILYLEFPENADIDKAADQVKQYADQAAGSLPDGAEAPEVQNIVVYDALMRIALTGDSPDELRRLARRLENELNALDVAKVNVRGIAKEEIQVRVPRGRLMELNTTARELGAAIAAQNRDASAGDVASGHSQRRLRALAKSENLFGLDSLPVGVGGGGDSQGGLRLGDIADIVRRPADRQKTQWFDGRPSVELQLQRRTGDNTLGFGGAAASMAGEEAGGNAAGGGTCRPRRAVAAGAVAAVFAAGQRLGGADFGDADFVFVFKRAGGVLGGGGNSGGVFRHFVCDETERRQHQHD